MDRIKWKHREFDFASTTHDKQDLTKRLLGTEGRIRKLLNRIPEVELELQVDGAWSIKKNVGHLTLLDEVHVIRLQELRSEQPTLTPADKKNSDTEATDFDSIKIGRLLADLETGRKELVNVLAGFTEQELKHEALHPRLNQKMTALDLAFFIAEHDDHHINSINRILDSLDFED